jgi:hypothetical protein
MIPIHFKISATRNRAACLMGRRSDSSRNGVRDHQPFRTGAAVPIESFRDQVRNGIMHDAETKEALACREDRSSPRHHRDKRKRRLRAEPAAISRCFESDIWRLDYEAAGRRHGVAPEYAQTHGPDHREHSQRPHHRGRAPSAAVGEESLSNAIGTAGLPATSAAILNLRRMVMSSGGTPDAAIISVKRVAPNVLGFLANISVSSWQL